MGAAKCTLRLKGQQLIKSWKLMVWEVHVEVESLRPVANTQPAGRLVVWKVQVEVERPVANTQPATGGMQSTG